VILHNDNPKKGIDFALLTHVNFTGREVKFGCETKIKSCFKEAVANRL
jgi:hypothetical protein